MMNNNNEDMKSYVCVGKEGAAVGVEGLGGMLGQGLLALCTTFTLDRN